MVHPANPPRSAVAATLVCWAGTAAIAFVAIACGSDGQAGGGETGGGGGGSGRAGSGASGSGGAGGADASVVDGGKGGAGAVGGSGGTGARGGAAGQGGGAGGRAGTGVDAGGAAGASDAARGGAAGTSSADATIDGADGSGGTRSDGAAGARDGAGEASSGADANPGDGGIVVPDGYILVWHDEFDVNGSPNPANWRYENGFVRNEEAQWYQQQNARVENGLLVIEGRRERVLNPNYQAGSTDWKTNRQYAEYTSSSLLTSGLHSWQFGRFEMRGRISARAGLWPAFWTLGVSGEWPSNGEVDIMEYYQNKLLFNVACGTTTRWVAKWDSATRDMSSLGDPTWDTKFHEWRMDWDDTKIDLYLDGQLMNTAELANMLNPDGRSPFRQPHYIILNLAIGGNNGGDPSGTAFPTRYEVDYVRVFQRR